MFGMFTSFLSKDSCLKRARICCIVSSAARAPRMIRSIDVFTSVILGGAAVNHRFAACAFANIDMSGWFSDGRQPRSLCEFDTRIAKVIFGSFPLIDVSREAIPQDDLAVGITQRFGHRVMPP